MRLAVCDDDRNILDAFESMLRDSVFAKDTELSVFLNAEGLLAACEKDGFDLIFSDIMLGDRDGIAVAAEINTLHPGTRVVFITSHVLEYAEDIFSLIRPYGYIGKPIHPPKVFYYIKRLEQELDNARRKIRVASHGTEYELLLADVRYFESDKRQIHIHCQRETLTVYDKLDNIERELDSRFVRCHQSFVVNLDWVKRMDGSRFVLRGGADGDDTITISRNHLQDSRKSYFEYKGRGVL